MPSKVDNCEFQLQKIHPFLEEFKNNKVWIYNRLGVSCSTVRVIIRLLRPTKVATKTAFDIAQLVNSRPTGVEVSEEKLETECLADSLEFSGFLVGSPLAYLLFV